MKKSYNDYNLILMINKENSSYDFYKEEKEGWKYHSFKEKITKISTKELLKNKLNNACLLVYKRKNEKEELEKRS